MRYVPICYGEACISQADLIEKCALVLLLSMGALVLLICAGFILYHGWRLFILLSDVIGKYLFEAHAQRKYAELGWFFSGLIITAILAYTWSRGAIPFLIFWWVMYRFLFRTGKWK